MSTTNKFKSLFPNYKDTFSTRPKKVAKTPVDKVKITRSSYRDADLANKRDPFEHTKELFKRRARKKDQSR